MSICTPANVFVLALVVAAWESPSVWAQYSKNATDSARQGNFINRNTDNSPKGGGVSSASSASGPAGAPAIGAMPPFREDPRIQWERERMQWEREQDWRDRQQWQRDQDRLDRLNNRQANANQNTNQFSGTGTISAVQAGVLVVNANGTVWQLKPAAGSKLEVAGIAGPDYLKPGLVVKFQAAFDSRAADKTKAVARITELEIITPHPGEMPGAAPAGAAAVKGAAIPGTARSLTVIGRVKSFKNNELTVDATNGVFKTDLDPATAIKVRVSDFSLVRAGDEIEATGFIANPGFAVANTMRVTMAHPLGNPLSEFGKRNPVVKPQNDPATARAANPDTK
jgi:hypothetical protein